VKARRRRGLLLLSVALASGGLAASQVRDRERSVAAQVGPAVPVLVAARDLPAGARVSAGVLALRRVPARFAPPDALGSADGVAGGRLAVPVAAGAYLSAGLFERSNGGHREGGGVGRGERAVTVEVSGAAGLVVGARVDVLVSTESGAGGRTVVALAGAELLRLEAAASDATPPDGTGAAAGATGPTALATLRVTLRQAVYLTAADNFAREIRLLTRPPGDRSNAGAPVSEGQL
jgi:pilus assembly protein CpaB